MNYSEALDFIYNAVGKGAKTGLENMRALMARLGDPQRRLRAFHVAGTNGKGSVCAYIDSALRTAGYHTGMYTSPHLERFNDRMRIDGDPVDDDKFAEAVSIVAPQVEALRAEGVYPTFFEITTATAFVLFERENVDYAVIEVGLGGRLDSTNIITPMVACIASIGFDHMKTLGDTLEEIASEKAGIIKPSVPTVISPQPENVRRVFTERCAETGSELIDLSTADMQLIDEHQRGAVFALKYRDIVWPRVEIGMAGTHQAINAATALMALYTARRTGALTIRDADILNGISAMRWPGRLEWFDGSPRILLDGAHNGPGARTLMEYARRHLSRERVVLLMAMLGDKPVEDVVRQAARISATAVITHISDTPRAIEPEKLAMLMEANAVSCRIEPELKTALSAARELAGPDGVVLVTGSLYLIGQVRELLVGS